MFTLFSLRRILAAPLLLLLLAVPAFAATYYVSPSGFDSNPGTYALPFLTIEHAVNAASSGDTVFIADGTYTGTGNYDIDLLGKNLTVKSVNGAAKTILDCQRNGRGFFIHRGETRVVLNGLTIENGGTDYDSSVPDSGEGGGLCIDGSSVTIQNCIFTGNTASGYFYMDDDDENTEIDGGDGGGLWSNAAVTLSGCAFNSNEADGNGGGLCINGGATLTNCTFTDNAAGYEAASFLTFYYGSGGGISNTSTLTLTNCSLTSNTSNSNGSGLYTYGTANVSSCVFTGNASYEGEGGGIASIGTLTCSGSTLSDNNSGNGGGIYSDGSTTLTDCTVSGNASYGDGGGITGQGYPISDSTLTMTGCTLTGNTTSGDGGGFYNDYSNTATLTNCSITSNTADSGGPYEGNGGGVANYSTANFIACKILQNTALNNGGGADNYGSTSLTNCTVFGNTTTNGQGGGLCVEQNGSSLSAINCTLTQNAAPAGEGGSVYTDSGSGTVTLTNDILYGDSGGEIVYSGTAPAVTYCDVDGGFTGTRNIDADPLFTRTPNLSAMPPDYGDLRLQATSPCLGAGNHAVAPATDKTGVTRPNPPSIGAFEAYAVLTSLSFNPATVAGGSANTTGTVTLNNPAPAGGATVSLSSSNGAITFSTPSVTIAAGTTTATFRAYSHSVSSTKTVTVTATYLGTSKVANVTVTPSTALSSLSFSPTTVAGGMVNTTGTVTLTGAAPSGGTVVSLASSNGAITFASSTVTVPAGATTATFRAYSHTVTSTKTVTVTATLNGVSKTATVTVTPAMASATLSSLSFSPTMVKGGSANTTGTVTLTSAAPSGGSVVSLGSSNAAITFPASTVTVAAGATSATFRAYSHHVSSIQHVTVTAVLSGTSKAATITVTP